MFMFYITSLCGKYSPNPDKGQSDDNEINMSAFSINNSNDKRNGYICKEGNSIKIF